jgi:NAD(P)-dependent dehydrogenase (short-subunit alcohol dehydrogenase family)
VTVTEGALHWFGGEDAIHQSAEVGPYANLLRRAAEPLDIANAIAFLCSPASRQMTGQVVHVSAGSVV